MTLLAPDCRLRSLAVDASRQSAFSLLSHTSLCRALLRTLVIMFGIIQHVTIPNLITLEKSLLSYKVTLAGHKG